MAAKKLFDESGKGRHEITLHMAKRDIRHKIPS